MESIADLQHSIHRSRETIAHQYNALSEKLDISSRLQHSIQRKPWSWMGGAVLAGITFSFLRKSKPPQKLISSDASVANLASPNKEKKKSPSLLSKILSSTAPFLESETALGILLPTARFLLPMIKPVVMDYASRKIHASTRRSQ